MLLLQVPKIFRYKNLPNPYRKVRVKFIRTEELHTSKRKPTSQAANDMDCAKNGSCKKKSKSKQIFEVQSQDSKTLKADSTRSETVNKRDDLDCSDVVNCEKSNILETLSQTSELVIDTELPMNCEEPLAENESERMHCLVPDANDNEVQGAVLAVPSETCEDETLLKYWCQRYRLFSRFDSGIKLDRGQFLRAFVNVSFKLFCAASFL